MTYEDDRSGLLATPTGGSNALLRRCRRAEWNAKKRHYVCADCGAGGFETITEYERHDRASGSGAEGEASPRLGRTARKGAPE